MGNTIAVGFPVWQSVASPFFESVVELHLPPEVPRKVLEGNLIAEQHERIARWFVEETTCDYLLLLEQDHRFPRNLLARVANYTDPIVGALYYTRNEPYWPVALVPRPERYNDPEVWKGDWSDVELTPMWPSLEDRICGHGLNSVCAIGMGCIAIRRDVLEDMPKDEPYFANHYEFGKYWTDDVWFCCRALQRGYQVYVDGDLVLPHMALRDVTHQTRRQHLQRLAAEMRLPVS